jgi:hypothetical protein
MIQILFLNDAPIYTAGTAQSQLQEHEDELQHLPWPAQSPDLNITEPVLDMKMFLQEKWYKILLQTVQNLYELIPWIVA